MIGVVAHDHNLPLVYSAPFLCTDNAVMIGWMGWELINAEQDVDIRDCVVNALKKIPLGSYVEGFVSSQTDSYNNFKKVMTNRNYIKK